MSKQIESISHEARVFPPPSEFVERARVSRAAYEANHQRSLADPEGFWLEQSAALQWSREPTRALQWDPPHARWFEDGQLNAAVNCLDRHAEGPRRDKIALRWEGEPGDERTLTYAELRDDVARLANALTALGLKAGERVAIYMGMVPEAAMAMLACARLGAVHSVIFGGFASDAVRDRVLDAGARFVITQDGTLRRGKVVPLKPKVDEALQACPDVEHVIMLRRANNEVGHVAGRDHDWHELLAGASPRHEAQAFDAEHPLFVLYTSGSTGKPKGVLHTTGGYLLSAHMTSRDYFDLRDDDVYWCTADVGWVTGHTYLVYGPLSMGATIMMYEGAPDTPDRSRFWSIVERHRVTILYTAPTAIRTFVRWGDDWVNKHDLSSLRLLGSVGEPINPEAWMWYREVVGKSRCPIVDTYWQTETGCTVLGPLPGAIDQKPGSCGRPYYGISPKVLRDDGSEAPVDEPGFLVIDRPWPGMFRTLWNNDARYRSAYFERFENVYLTGDAARRDADGYFWIVGRTDDVVNVSGHRLGTAEIESVLVAHPSVAEAAVVAAPDPVTGEALVAFVTPRGDVTPSSELAEALAAHVASQIGRFARPKQVRLADALPKTRSGKIMRRLLRDLAAGREVRGDVTTLEDASVLDQLRGDGTPA